MKKDDSSLTETASNIAPSIADVGKLPWHRSITHARLANGGGLQGIASHDNINVAWVSGAVPKSDERLDFIVKAANCHHDLFEALKAALGALRFNASEQNPEATTLDRTRYEKARAAIAKATDGAAPKST